MQQFVCMPVWKEFYPQKLKLAFSGMIFFALKMLTTGISTSLFRATNQATKDLKLANHCDYNKKVKAAE